MQKHHRATVAVTFVEMRQSQTFPLTVVRLEGEVGQVDETVIRGTQHAPEHGSWALGSQASTCMSVALGN